MTTRSLQERAVRVRRTAAIARSLPPRPVCVYTPGKVGSMTLWRTIESATGRPTVHFHTMTRAGYQAAVRAPGRLPTGYIIGRIVGLRRQIRRGGPPWEFVTAVRDPLSRFVSAYFQVGDRYSHHWEVTSSADLAQQLTEFYWREVAPVDWWRDEFRATLGIDVYAHGFDPESGWRTYEGDNLRVMLVRVEDLDRVGPGALKTFFGLHQPPGLVQTNVGSDKGYGAIYRRLVSQLTLPDDLIQDALGTREATHFYSPTERQRFAARFSG